MKTYNIGVVQGDGKKLGFTVVAKNMDAAYAKVVNLCAVLEITLMRGHAGQLRSDTNEWFDSTYPRMADIGV